MRKGNDGGDGVPGSQEERMRQAEKRMKRGECATCGLRLFTQGRLLKRRTPLDIPGLVMQGRCLRCFPITQQEIGQINPQTLGAMPPVQAGRFSQQLHVPQPQQLRTQQQRLDVPQELTVHDDATVVSAITVEHFPARPQVTDEPVVRLTSLPALGGESIPRPTEPIRPEASTSGSSQPPGPPRRPIQRPISEHRNPSAGDTQPPDVRLEHLSQPAQVQRMSMGISPSRIKKPAWPGTISETQPFEGELLENPGLDSRLDGPGEEENEGSQNNPQVPSDAASTLSFDLESFDSLPVHLKNDKEQKDKDKVHLREVHESEMLKPPASSLQDINEESANLSYSNLNASGNINHSTTNNVNGSMANLNSNSSSMNTDPGMRSFDSMLHLEGSNSSNNPRQPARLGARRPDSDVMEQLIRPPVREPRHTMDEVEAVLSELGATEDSARKVELLAKLTECIWDIGGPAKDAVVNSNCSDTLAMILWADMMVLPTVTATASLLLALVAQAESSRESHVFASSGAADGLLDALLITMQSQVEDESFQEICCRIFCCLASQSGVNGNVNDGTLSGAVQSILKAMDVHSESERIQEWGVRSLYNQCVYSRNAEPNKRTLASVKMDSGVKGSTVLQRILAKYSATDSVVEWCCKLYWVLSASADVAEMLSPATEPIQDMYRLLQALSVAGPTAIPTHESILGALSNFSTLESNKTGSDETDNVFFLFDNIRSDRSGVGVVVESCNLMTAMVLGERVNRGRIVQEGAVRFLTDAMESYSSDPVVFEAVLRTLVELAKGSLDTKSDLCDPDILSRILRCSGSLKRDHWCQEMCITLLASILVPEALGQDHPEQDHIVDYIIFATSAYPDSKRLYDASCQVIRNLSCIPEYSPFLSNSDILKILVHGIRNFTETASIQASACCSLWNLNFDRLINADHIQSILATLQNHLDNEKIAHMGCGALWNIVSEADKQKKMLVECEGGVETVACVLVMHPDREELLECACGLLTSLTASSDLVEAVLRTQAFHNVVDVMRSDRAGVNILESGTLLVRNVCLVFPEFAKEAAGVVPAVMQGMKKHGDEANFQKAACSFLWLVATQSNEAKSKILSMDGVPTLMNIMEQYSGLEDVQEAALGAFRELTLSY